jgi:transmembrane sensor
MNSSPQHQDPVADEQAALWAARLDGDILDRAQRAELDAWLAQKPAHRTLLSQYCQFSADLEEQVPALLAVGAVSPVSVAKADCRRGKWTFPRVACVTLAAAATIAMSIFVLRPSPQVQNIATASAQRGPHTLADGTRVELNANTSLRFENTKTKRLVRLAGGEALFTVTKDRTRPFVVETPAGSVTVTGTVFNIRTDASRDAFEVTVAEGSVEVRPGDLDGLRSPAPVSLRARDQFSSRTGDLRQLSESELDDILAWRQGTIVFRDVPLSEAAARFAQYHGRAINVATAIANERVGGRHSIDDLHGFLAGIELALPKVKYHYDPSGAVVLSLR